MLGSYESSVLIFLWDYLLSLATMGVSNRKIAEAAKVSINIVKQ